MLFNKVETILYNKSNYHFIGHPSDKFSYFMKMVFKSVINFNIQVFFRFFSSIFSSYLPKTNKNVIESTFKDTYTYSKQMIVRKLLNDHKMFTILSLLINKKTNLFEKQIIIFPENKKHPMSNVNNHYEQIIGNVFTKYTHPFHLVDPSPWPF